jgi:uncharacterized coiled-coil protein SlyX
MANGIDDLGKKSEIAVQKQVTAFAKLNSLYAAQERKVEKLREALEAYSETKIPTQAYAEVRNQIEKTEQKLTALLERQQKFLDTGGRTNSSTYKKMQYDIEQLNNSLKYAKGELKDLDGLTSEIGDMSKDAECREERDLVKRYVDKLRDML